MTLLVKIGRRVPRSWFKRQVKKGGGLITFQENMWIMIKQSMTMAKKKANASGKLKFVMTMDSEHEDLNYDLQWIKIVIQGTKEQEQEEYEETMQMYQPFGKIFKKEMPKDDRMKKHFKTKVLSAAKVDDAYKKGYGSVSDNNIANKLLEMGIMTHAEILDDYDTRDDEVKPDF